MAKMSSLDQQIQQAIVDLSIRTGTVQKGSRNLTLSLAKKLVVALEDPEDVVMHYILEVWLQLCNLFDLEYD